MNFEQLFRPMFEQMFIYLFWLFLLFMILSLIKTVWLPRLRGLEGEKLVRKKLQKHGLEALHDIILEDNQHRLTQVDHLVKMPWGLLAIETKNYYGTILGNKHQKKWIQRIKYHNRSFNNPLHQNYAHVKTVQGIVPDIPVKGLVVFTDRACFPKGLPDGVCQLKDLMLELSAFDLPALPLESLNKAWLKLQYQAKTDVPSRRRHLNALQEKYGKNQFIGRLYRVLAVLTIVFIVISFWLSGIKNRVSSSVESVSALSVVDHPAGQRKNMGYKEQWISGRPLEECIGADKELNENVLRCRHGYKRTIPVYGY